eukprot:6354461-Alexandrium_andersonii.AAC.1
MITTAPLSRNAANFRGQARPLTALRAGSHPIPATTQNHNPRDVSHFRRDQRNAPGGCPDSDN